MADYRLSSIAGQVIRTSDGAFIPNDPLNMDRIAYNAWLALGNTPDAADPPIEPLPAAEVTRRAEIHADTNRLALVAQTDNSTVVQISTFVDNNISVLNVLGLGNDTRAMIKKILLEIAEMRARQGMWGT